MGVADGKLVGELLGCKLDDGSCVGVDDGELVLLGSVLRDTLGPLLGIKLVALLCNELGKLLGTALGTSLLSSWLGMFVG